MARGIEIPITPEVLYWAIKQSGYDEETLADKLDVPSDIVREWASGVSLPLKSKFDRLTKILKRPSALFFLPEPPEVSHSPVSFRHPADSERESLSPKELQYIREVRRIQQTLGWAREQMDEPTASIGRFSQLGDPEKAAKETRRHLNISIGDQLSWKNSSKAQASWRLALEKIGILVFFLPMGKQSVRGFSLAHDIAPAIAVNTWWNSEARIFGLLHEYGHLVTDSSSACLDSPRQLRRSTGDPIERWCERFAASVILPWDELAQYAMQRFGWPKLNAITDLEQIYSISRKFKVSARATAIRFIDKGYADWEIYRAIPAVKDHKKGGGASGGRNRFEIRRDEYGASVPKLFIKAVDRDLIERTEALSFLNISDSDLDGWRE